MVKKQNMSLFVGMFLLGVIMFTILVSTSFLVFKVPINVFNMPLAVILSAAAVYIFGNKSFKTTAIVAGIGVAIIIASAAICFFVYDWSWDGNTYHKSMLAFLEDGWNPFYNSFYEYADANFKFLSEEYRTWYDAYPKGLEIFGACLYKITGNIEVGKCYNLIGTVSAGLVTYAMLGEKGGLKAWQKGVGALLFALNPVMLSQMFTYYNDGFLFSTILICIFACFYLTFFENGQFSPSCYFLVFSAIGVGFNTKFSGVIFFAMPCGLLFLYWCYKKWKEGFTKIGKRVLALRFGLLALSVIFGTVFTGASSYVVNTFRYHNPVYTMIGEGSTDIMVYNTPEAFLNMSNLKSFLVSLFSRTAINKNLEATELKIPFTFNASEVNSAMACDTRTAGWGILFSGILIVSLIVLGAAFLYYRKRKPELCIIGGIFVFIGIICVLFVPSMWWARYFVYLFYLPAAAVVYLFLQANRNSKQSQKQAFLAGALTLLLFLNIVPNVTKTVDIFKDYPKQKAEIQKLYSATQYGKVSVSCGLSADDSKFWGRMFNLYDSGVTDFKYSKNVAKNYTATVFSNSKPVYYKVEGGIMSSENISEFIKEYKKLDNVALIITAKDEASTALDKDTIALIKSLGLEFEMKDKFRYSYISVIDNGSVIYEKLSENRLYYNGEIDNASLEVKSAGKIKGNIASVKIDDVEYALNMRGLNMVVYDKENKVVIDSICIDTFETNALTRQ